MSAATWHTVKPKLMAELEAIRQQLTTCDPSDLAALQARHAALETIREWFDAGSPEERQISTAATTGGY